MRDSKISPADKRKKLQGLESNFDLWIHELRKVYIQYPIIALAPEVKKRVQLARKAGLV